MNRPWGRSLFLTILLTSLAWTAAATVPWLAETFWTNQKREILASVERALGGSLSYDFLSSNVLESLDFHNVRIRSDKNMIFQAAGVRVFWNWGAILQGHENQAIAKIQIVNASIDLDTQRDSHLIKRIRDLLDTTNVESPQLPPIEIFSLTANWTTESGQYGLKKAFVTLRRVEGELEIAFRTTLTARLSVPSELKTAESRLQGVLRVDTRFQQWILNAHADFVRTNLADMDSFGFQLEKTPDILRFSKTQDNQPLDLSFELVQGVLKAQLKTDRYRFNHWIHWKNSPDIDSWLATQWTGQASLLWSSSTGAWSADLDGHAEFSTPMLPEGSSFQGALQGNARQITFKNAIFRTPRLDVAFNGDVKTDTWLPEGFLQIRKAEIPNWGNFTGALILNRVGDTCNFLGKNWLWNRLRFQGVQGKVQLNQGLFSYALNLGLEGFSNATLILSGQGERDFKKVSMAYVLTNLPLNEVAKNAGVYPLDPTLAESLEGWQASAQGNVNLNFPEVEMYPTSCVIEDVNDPQRNLTFALSYQNKVLSVADLVLKWKDFQLEGHSLFDFHNKEKVTAHSFWEIYGKKLEVDAEYSIHDHRAIWGGSSGIAGIWQKSNQGWQSSFQVQEFPLQDGGSLSFQGHANGTGDGVYGNVDWAKWTSFYPGRHQPFSVVWAASFEPGRATSHILSWKDAWGDRQGSLHLSWGDLEQPWRANLNLVSPEGEVFSSDASFLWGKTLVIGAQWKSSPLERVLPDPWHGTLAGRGTLTWSRKVGFVWKASVTSEKAFNNNDPVNFSLNATGNDSGIEISNFKADWKPLSIDNGNLLLDWKTRSWEWSARQSVALGTKTWSWNGDGKGNWKGEAALAEITADYDWKNAKLGKASLRDGSATFLWKENAWKLATKDGVVMLFGSPDGDIQVEIQSSEGLIVHADGALTNGQLDFDVTSFRVPLHEVGQWMDSDLFQIQDGFFIGSVHIQGPVTDPGLTGDASFKQLVFRDIYVREPIGPVDAEIEFRDKTITVSPVNIGPKDQIWMLDASLHIDHGLPDRFQIDVNTDGLSLIPIRYLLTGVDVEGWISGSVQIQGDSYAATISGKLLLQNTEVRLVTSPQLTGDYYGINVDLLLQTGRKVEFLWPDPNLPLVRAVSAVGQTLIIRYNEQTSKFAMIGKIDLKAGEINYVSQTFQIQEGRLTFQETENSFDPHLLVRAELKVREADGPVLIELHADSPLSRFSPSFSTIPYKTPEELQQLIGTSFIPSTENANSALLGSVASDLGTGFLLRPFEESVKKNFGLDLFSVRTQILAKALTQTATSSQTPGYLDNTRVYFGKYLGDDLFLQGDLNFHQDQIIGGVQTSGLLIDPEIQMEFNTPFFLLNWTLVPQHPENLFVTDSSVTFSWNWSY